jgi:PEP-CTERM motif
MSHRSIGRPTQEVLMTIRTLLASLFALILVCGAGPSAAIAVPVLDFADGFVLVADDLGPDAVVAGWAFAVTSPVAITALGFFDVDADGLAADHEITLLDSALSPIASATITTANSVPVPSTSSLGAWRFTPITPITLDPGEYAVGAGLAAGDPDGFVASATATTIPAIEFDLAILASAPGTGFAALPGFNDGFFGPNLFATQVPEPSSLVLLGAALATLGGLAWRARR